MRVSNLFLVLLLIALPAVAGRSSPAEAFGRLPVAFEPNAGQTDPRVAFVARSPGQTIFLTSSGAVLSLGSGAAHAVVRVTFPGSRDTAPLEGEGPLRGRHHYLRGKDPKLWRTNVPLYSRVRCRDLYPGIDTVVYGNRKRLEYDFVIAPGADPSVIRLLFEGPDSVRVTSQGDLLVATRAGDLLHHKPVAYQETGDGRHPVEAEYVLGRNGEVSFRLGDYDPSRELVIDPVIGFSTFLGGSGLEQGLAVAVDNQGNVYVAGTTQSPDFPTTEGTGQPDYKEGEFPGDAFISKLNPEGTALIYSTYLGGTRRDIARAIVVDSQGNVYVAGETESTDFPVPLNAYQWQNLSIGVFAEGFVAKLDPGGSNLLYATYLGASFTDRIYSLAVDSSGSAYVAGSTDSGLFPTTGGAFQSTCTGYGLGGFVTKFNPSGTDVEYSTLLCGSANDEILGITVDSQGNAYLTGVTTSRDFPVTGGAVGNPGTHGDENSFLTKLAADGTKLLYSRLLGGSAPDTGAAVAVDNAGNAWITGHTRSTDFPVTATALQKEHADRGLFDDAFLSVLNADGSQLLSSTYLGGAKQDRATALALDDNGAVYLTGFTESPDFPVTAARCQTGYRGRRDAFLAKLSSTGNTLDYALFLGGLENDTGYAVAAGAGGKAYIAGETKSPNFVTTNDAFRSAYRSGYAGASDSFVARVDNTAAPAAPCIALNAFLNGGSFLPGPISPGEIVSIFGSGLGPASPVQFTLNGDTIDKELSGTRILFDGTPAPVLLTSDWQVNTIVPYSVRIGETTTIQVEYQGVTTASLTLPVTASSPAIFTLNSSGRGAGAILNQDSSVNTPTHRAVKGTVIQIYATGEGQTNPPGVDGKVALTAWPKPLLPVTILIGGVKANIEYAGAAPSLVAGVIQINARVPVNVSSGAAVPVVIKIGDKTSPPGVTLAVQ